MKRIFVFFACLFLAAPLLAQRPSDPALLVPETAPELDYTFVPDAIKLPEGSKMGAAAAVAFDARGHIYVLTRGAQAFFEFDENGGFVRSFGDGMFTRSHGLKIDRDGNLWATDVGAHTVVKLNPAGQVLLTIGTKGQAGEWNETAGSHLLNQPNDVAIAANGDIFVAQGHTPGAGGDARVLKFDKDGRFITQWGGKGKEPGQFVVAHGIVIDGKGLLWVMDRENQRVQVFDSNGTFVREQKYKGLPCSVAFGRDEAYMVNGFAGQLLRLDLNGKVLAAMGKPGTGPGEFGEAHFLAISPRNDLYVADSVNGMLMKFVRKK
ncbi:MAG TPA: peptidyl-alpha-hydroxyglycine alpha-amidating lyase family protein [Vicinamibacterales bacterium]|jgi:sugar lactone lactonase YvrE|nr:peptidyl-alpha-hydroxyglycine alpha-amidating lyase family protein [Vicinamibacterales bacterium]